MIELQITGDKALVAKFAVFPQRLREALTKNMTSLAVQLESYIKREKLSGQVLGVITGNLRDSISHEVESGPSSVVARVFSGGNLPYAAIHEYGGTIHHPGGTAYFLDSNSLMAVFVANSNPLAQHLPRTRPHEITIPERSYMRSSLEDYRERIMGGMNDAVKEAFK